MNISRPVADRKPSTANPARILIIGNPQQIEQLINHLCVLGFCERLQWSPIVPYPETGEFMSILTKKG